jgi:ABC-type glycerol-3-phosphate transport system permease component
MSGNATAQAIPRRGFFRRRVHISSVIITTILLLYAFLIIFPLCIPFFFVSKTILEYNYHPWALPEQIRFFNFVEAWKAVRIDMGLRNTFLVCLGSVSITVTSAALAGYIFAQYRSLATEIMFYVVLAGYFVPVQMVLIPMFRMSAKLGLYNTLPGLFMPLGTFGIPFWSLIYRSFYQKLPKDIADAARIDGAGHWTVFILIMFPLAMPATILALLLSFMSAWSDFLISLVMLSKPQLFTMQLRVATFMDQYGVSDMPRYAAAVIISAAPTVILYVIGHRWIIRGTLAGALKG